MNKDIRYPAITRAEYKRCKNKRKYKQLPDYIVEWLDSYFRTYKDDETIVDKYNEYEEVEVADEEEDDK